MENEESLFGPIVLFRASDDLSYLPNSNRGHSQISSRSVTSTTIDPAAMAHFLETTNNIELILVDNNTPILFIESITAIRGESEVILPFSYVRANIMIVNVPNLTIEFKGFEHDNFIVSNNVNCPDDYSSFKKLYLTKIIP